MSFCSSKTKNQTKAEWWNGEKQSKKVVNVKKGFQHEECNKADLVEASTDSQDDSKWQIKMYGEESDGD